MTKKKAEKIHKGTAQEVTLDDLDMDLLKEVGISDDEINDFNKEVEEKKKSPKKETKKTSNEKQKKEEFDAEMKIEDDLGDLKISPNPDSGDFDFDEDFELDEELLEPTAEDLE
ncbi:MAG: hypothetical protein LBF15_03610 [Candidatus Peribacteria bacterium]|jgi:hypothetical protein|nr:hypothetical protein [Candidatus Peribacteria bacterium]